MGIRESKQRGIANFRKQLNSGTGTRGYFGDERVVVVAEHIRPMVDRAHLTQIQELATLRDTLLPRLISGQLRLPPMQSHLQETTA